MSRYVHYGCGKTAPTGWLNFDISPRLRVEKLPIFGNIIRLLGMSIYPINVRYGDIVRGLPVECSSADALYCSHVLEHIDRVGVEKALANSFKILTSGGVFRLVLPDLEWRARRFVEENTIGDPRAADRLIRSAYIGVEDSPKSVIDRLRLSFGNSAHRWMYDYAAMVELLEKAGFIEIRRVHLGDSKIAEFAQVELVERFEEDGHQELAIEARRP